MNPEYGVNALVPLVESYIAINGIKNSLSPDTFAVIGIVIKEGGTASNVIPERAVMEVDIRAKESSFLNELQSRIAHIAQNIAAAHDAGIKIENTTPLYEDYKPSRVIDKVLEEECISEGISVVNIDEIDENPMGSTDESNVSQVVPTGHIDIKITDPGVPAHSDKFRAAANPDLAGANLIRSIEITFKSIEKIITNKNIMRNIKDEFGR